MDKINQEFSSVADLGGKPSNGVAFNAASLDLPVPLAQLQRDAQQGNVKSFGNAALAANVVDLPNVVRIDNNAPTPAPTTPAPVAKTFG
jgi:hypothetical protein